MLRAIDLVVLLKITTTEEAWSIRDIAYELKLSASSVHGALQRGAAVGVFSSERRKVVAPKLEEALQCGAKYFLAPKRGRETRGLPTSWAAPPLSKLIVTSDPLIPVWPDPEGPARGISFEPLYPSAAAVAKCDGRLYELLALVDVLREGRARESALAREQLHMRLCTK